MKNKKSLLFLIFIIGFVIFPSSVFAITIKHTSLWGNNYEKIWYQTLGYQNINDHRDPSVIGKYIILDGNINKGGNAFCIDPKIKFGINNTLPGYTATSTYAVHPKANDMSSVMSCFNPSSNESVIAAQILIWELTSGERAKIDSEKILLQNNYIPYQANGTIYYPPIVKGLGTYGPEGLALPVKMYNILARPKQAKIFNEYKAILRCSARFDPQYFKKQISNLDITDSAAKSKPKMLTEYNESTRTFSTTISLTNTAVRNSINYYKIESNDPAVKVSKSTSKIIITSTKEISKTNPVLLKFTYTYKDDGKTSLPKVQGMTYFKRAETQTLAWGTRNLNLYMYVYTDKAPIYQLRVKKVDEEGNPLKGAEFKVYGNYQLTQYIATITTGDDGYAYYRDIKNPGNYYVKETSAPDGYVPDNASKYIKVESGDKVGTNNYGEIDQGKPVVNKSMDLELEKKTIDEDGKIVNIPDYTENGCKGTYTGGKFTIKKGTDYLKLREVSPGNYVLDDKAESSEIKTCNGTFNIKGIKKGDYVITEIQAPTGYQLPAEPSKKVTIKAGDDLTTVTMYNGVTGVVFNKVNDEGELIDGGKYSLQVKQNNIYRDVLLKHEGEAVYKYVEGLTEDSEGATYILETVDGTINIKNLPPGEYRIVEKQAPEGYEIIAEKDSTAVFTISDKSTEGNQDFYQVQLVNQKAKVEGSSDSAEFIVTITTGRNVINYTLLISGLAAALVIIIILRKKFKK